MWKKNESIVGDTVSEKLNTSYEIPENHPSQRPAVGVKTLVHGDLVAEEDLVIAGRVQGKIEAKNHMVTIATTGWLGGNVFAKVVKIEGDVVGDISAVEKVIVYKSGNVRGNITAPRVTLEDGAKLKGVIDMEPSQPEWNNNILADSLTRANQTHAAVTSLTDYTGEEDKSDNDLVNGVEDEEITHIHRS